MQSEKNAESDQLKPIKEGFIDQHSSVLSKENNKPKVNSDTEMLRHEITTNNGPSLSIVTHQFEKKV